jgi:hypothetical protein
VYSSSRQGIKQQAIGSAGRSNKQQVTNIINKKCEEIKRQKKGKEQTVKQLVKQLYKEPSPFGKGS